MKSVVPNSAKAFRYDEEGGIGYGIIDEGKVRPLISMHLCSRLFGWDP